MDYNDLEFSKLRHDLKGHVRRQEIILGLIFDSMRENKEIDPRFLQDMEVSINTISEKFLKLVKIIEKK